MYCKKCGKQINKDINFCPYCSVQIKSKEIGTIFYCSIFWKYFCLSILLNIFSIFLFEDTGIVWFFYLIAVFVYTYFFCLTINNAMTDINKKNWWPIGLLVLIPMGFWIVFFIIRSQLKPHNKWSSKKGISPWVIILIFVAIIIIIGILATVVLVSLNDVRERSEEAQKQYQYRLDEKHDVSSHLIVPGALRTCPSTNCQIVRYYSEGAKVTIKNFDSTQLWYEVTVFDDYGFLITGYMHSSLF